MSNKIETIESQKMEKPSKFEPLLGSSVIFLILLVLTYLVVSQVETYIETNQIAIPQVSTSFAIFYFLGSVVVMGIILYLIPVSVLRLVLKALFAFMFAWGVFVFAALYLPVVAAGLIAAGLGLFWFIQPRLWLHNILLIFSLVSLGATLGPMFSPWAVSLLLGALSVYDLVAVGSGYMMWMVKQMASSETVPAFLIPRKLTSWNMTFKQAGLTGLLSDEPGKRELSVLGGGDLGLPLVLITSVYFTYGFLSSLIVSLFTFFGLFFAYFIQIYVIKGKPLPALPPISSLAVIGLLIAYFLQA
jgi:presenilin-like A22 family membrane protease